MRDDTQRLGSRLAFTVAVLLVASSTVAAGQTPGTGPTAATATAEGTLASFPTRDSWETEDAATSGWNPEALEDALAFAGEQQTTGLVIVQGGRIVAERYWNDPSQKSDRLARMTSGHTAAGHTIEDVASVQKSVIAFLMGVAEGKGLVDLEASATTYLGAGWSQASVDQEASITVRHLMTMTSGLNEDATYDGPAGSIWKYNTSVYSRTVKVLEKVTGLEINDLTSQWLTDRIGMSDSSWTERTWVQGGEAANAIGFSTSARDLARFGLLILNGGVWQGDDLLGNPGFLERALSPSQDLNPSYGFLWWLNGQSATLSAAGATRRQGPMLATAPDDLVAAQGALGRRCFVVPSLDLVVTRLGDQPNEPLTFDAELWQLLMKAAPSR